MIVLYFIAKSCLIREPDTYDSLTVSYTCVSCESLVNKNIYDKCSTTQNQYQIDSLYNPSHTSTIRIDKLIFGEINDNKLLLALLAGRKSIDHKLLTASIKNPISTWVN